MRSCFSCWPFNWPWRSVTWTCWAVASCLAVASWTLILANRSRAACSSALLCCCAFMVCSWLLFRKACWFCRVVICCIKSTWFPRNFSNSWLTCWIRWLLVICLAAVNSSWWLAISFFCDWTCSLACVNFLSISVCCCFNFCSWSVNRSRSCSCCSRLIEDTDCWFCNLPIISVVVRIFACSWSLFVCRLPCCSFNWFNSAVDLASWAE